MIGAVPQNQNLSVALKRRKHRPMTDTEILHAPNLAVLRRELVVALRNCDAILGRNSALGFDSRGPGMTP